MNVSNDHLDIAVTDAPSATGNVVMVLCQTALGIAILFAWQGVSGRLVDNFFISNPIDVGRRLLGWTLDGSIFIHLWATVYATTLGFVIGSVIGACARHLARYFDIRQPASESLSERAQCAAQGGFGAAVCPLVRPRH